MYVTKVIFDDKSMEYKIHKSMGPLVNSLIKMYGMTFSIKVLYKVNTKDEAVKCLAIYNNCNESYSRVNKDSKIISKLKEELTLCKGGRKALANLLRNRDRDYR